MVHVSVRSLLHLGGLPFGIYILVYSLDRTVQCTLVNEYLPSETWAVYLFPAYFLLMSFQIYLITGFLVASAHSLFFEGNKDIAREGCLIVNERGCFP